MPKRRHLPPNAALRQARIKRGWSQQQVAERIGTHSFTVSRWERGYTAPSPYYRQKLIELFAQPPALLGLLPPGALPEAASIPSQSDTTSAAVPPGASALHDPLLPPPPTLTTGLIGREALLARLKARLLEGNTLALSALQGLPGVGKTALALALAHDPEVRAHFADGVLWTGLGQTPRIQETLARWGMLLGLAPAEAARLTTIQAWAQALRATIGARRLLFVLDDAWHVEDVLACQVGGANCAYLVTARRPDLALLVAGEGLVTVPELNEAAGLALLARLAPQVVEAEPEEARALVQVVGGLPLGLVLLGRYLQRQSYGGQPRRIHAALTRVQQGAERLQLAQPQAPLEAHPSLPAGTPLSLEASIGLSAAALTPEARVMLAALALFPPKPNSFSEEAALAVSAGMPETLDALVDAGLVESAGMGRYMLHQAIVDYARLQSAPAGVAERLVEYMVAAVERHQREYTALDQEAWNILAALEVAFQRRMQPLLIRGVQAFQPFLEARGWYASLQQQLTRAYEAASTLEDMTRLASILLQLGHVRQKQGDYAQAEAAFTDALRLARQQQQDHTVCAALYALGALAGRRGAYAQAEAHLQAGLRLARQQDFQDQLPGLLSSLGNLANLRGDYAQAESYFQEGLAIARQHGQPERISGLLVNLGVIAEKRGQLQQAETFYQEGLVVARQVGHQERTILLLVNLGSVTTNRGNFCLAEAYLQEGVALAREIQHPEYLAFALANLGLLTTRRGDFHLAETFLQEGLALARQINHRELTAVLLTHLGMCARHAGDYTQAAAYLQEGQEVAVELHHRLLLITILQEWGELHLARQQYEQAAAALAEALQLARQEGHQSSLAQALYSLAQVAQAEGAIDQAQRLGQESLAIFQAIGHYQAAEVEGWLHNLEERGAGAAEPEEGRAFLRWNGARRQRPTQG